MDFQEVKQSIHFANMKLERKLGNRDSLLKRESGLKQRVQEIDEECQLFEKVTMFLQRFAEDTRGQVDNQFESVVTQALQEVLDDSNLEFRVVSGAKRGVISTEFQLCDQGTGQLFSVLVSFGGGVADIISVITRLVFLELYVPRISGPVVLDENLKFLSKDKSAKALFFLNNLVKSFGRQMIWISHDPTVLTGETGNVVDKIIRVKKRGGVSVLEEVK